jgi:hypothetical protein
MFPTPTPVPAVVISKIAAELPETGLIIAGLVVLAIGLAALILSMRGKRRQ